MTVEWTNLSSGLLGAFIGFAGSVVLYLWDRRARQKGAGRAVLAEMMANARWALNLKGQGLSDGFSDQAWASQLPLIAQFVRWPDLEKLTQAYDSAARLSKQTAGLELKDRLNPDWNETALGLAKEFRDAIEGLHPRVVSSRDFCMFAEQLSDFDTKLKKSQEREAVRDRQARAQDAAVEIMTGVSPNKRII